MSISIAVIGECMLELSHAKSLSDGAAKPMAMSYGGDTINTSIYLSRNNVSVTYVTALGDDLMSDWLLDEWSKEGIDCSLVQRMKNSVPAVYMINVDDNGERSFLYWRKNSPASRIFDDQQTAHELLRSLYDFPYVYLSGISLAILPEAALERLLGILRLYKENGGKIIFDGNYRPKLWSSRDQAQKAYLDLYRITDIALPTLEDEGLLFGYDSAKEVLCALQRLGCSEIVVKMGGEGCLAHVDGQTLYIAADKVDPIDTTAAGDSFNAGYIAARLQNRDGESSCKAGHLLASKVIQYRGAIMPRSIKEASLIP